ncbi:ead/Ea22-like family protein [Atlantibacter hermannii]|uniref:ead/Ea22-like family protein n=1 Tax=Atlantibacter hermannii TaxID=565 RepID=UPI002FF76B9D
MTTAEQLAQLREVARSASAGDWIKESGDGWEAVSSSDDQANGGFIIAHFEGPDAKANREFMQAATPNVVLALLDELERKDKQIAEMTDERTASMNELSRIIQAETNAKREALQRIAELEARHTKLRESMAAIHNTIRLDGVGTSLSGLLSASKRAWEESAPDSGINLTVEG